MSNVKKILTTLGRVASLESGYLKHAKRGTTVLYTYTVLVYRPWVSLYTLFLWSSTSIIAHLLLKCEVNMLNGLGESHPLNVLDNVDNCLLNAFYSKLSWVLQRSVGKHCTVRCLALLGDSQHWAIVPLFMSTCSGVAGSSLGTNKSSTEINTSPKTWTDTSV